MSVNECVHLGINERDKYLMNDGYTLLQYLFNQFVNHFDTCAFNYNERGYGGKRRLRNESDLTPSYIFIYF